MMRKVPQELPSSLRPILLPLLVASYLATGCQYFSASFETAASLDQEGKGIEAIGAYEKYLKLHSSGPLGARASYRVAKNYAAQGDYENAIAWYEKVLQEHRDSEEETWALLDLATLYRDNLKDSAKSMEFSQRAFLRYMAHAGAKGAAEELVEAQFKTAKSFYEKGEYKKASETAGSIFQAYPSAFVTTETRARVDALSDRSRRADLLSRSSVDLVFMAKTEVFSKAFEADFPPVVGPTDRIPSPDGKYVVERKKSPNGTFHLYVAEVPAKGDKLVFKVLKPTFGAGIPSWSGDGKDLIYVRSIGGRKKMERTNVKTRITQTLFWTEGREYLGSAVSYHPSGSMIAFIYSGNVWIMNPNGFKSRLKNQEILSYTAGLSWSKDGTMVRYWDKNGPKTKVDGVLTLDANVIP